LKFELYLSLILESLRLKRHTNTAIRKDTMKNRMTMTISNPATRSKRGNRINRVALPSLTLGTDIGLLEQTVGPVIRDQSGVRWSPVREMFECEGAFHG
jgi:hypothetical protein